MKGIPKKSNTGELSIIPTEIRLMAPCFHSIPAYHGLKDTESRYRKRYLDLMINDPVRQRFLIRSKVKNFFLFFFFFVLFTSCDNQIINCIRKSLEDDHYIEVETPTLWSDAGGANAVPFTTHLKALDESVPLYLRVAPELFLKV